MPQAAKPIELRKGEQPPCLGNKGYICRGCPGWRAMLEAAKPGGAWHGLAVHCTVSGLTVTFGADNE